MNRVALSFPELAIIAGTRAALGAGVGLLVADRLSAEQRRAVGLTLVGVGVLTTIPIAVQLFKSSSGGATGAAPEGTVAGGRMSTPVQPTLP